MKHRHNRKSVSVITLELEPRKGERVLQAKPIRFPYAAFGNDNRFCLDHVFCLFFPFLGSGYVKFLLGSDLPVLTHPLSLISSPLGRHIRIESVTVCQDRLLTHPKQAYNNDRTLHCQGLPPRITPTPTEINWDNLKNCPS